VNEGKNALRAGHRKWLDGSNNCDFLPAEIRGHRDFFIEFDYVDAKSVK
jgi:hypothetical protein